LKTVSVDLGRGQSLAGRASSIILSIIMITCGTFGRLFNHADIVQDILFHVLSGISVSSKERNQTKQKQ